MARKDDLRKSGAALIEMYVGQQPTDEELRPLHGEEAILYQIPRMKQILGWSGISPKDALDIVKQTTGPHKDELMQAFERINQESQQD